MGVMAMKENFTFPRALGLEPHHQMQFSVIPFLGGYSCNILNPTNKLDFCFVVKRYNDKDIFAYPIGNTL